MSRSHTPSVLPDQEWLLLSLLIMCCICLQQSNLSLPMHLGQYRQTGHRKLKEAEVLFASKLCMFHYVT